MYSYQNAENGIELLKFEKFRDESWMEAVFTSRTGGVSTGNCESLNLSYRREENKKNVLKNIKRTAECMGIAAENMVMAQQTHSNHVGVVKEKHFGSGAVSEVFFTDCDALVTNVQGAALTTIHGDCVPVFLCDPQKKAVGMIHSGWKGTLLRISRSAVAAMVSEYGTNPADIKAVIGPSICKNCFEIRADVLDEFKKEFQNPDSYLNQKDNETWTLDLPGLICETLRSSGIQTVNIDQTGICTYENKERYFSHRREKGSTGAMAGIIYIRSES